MRTVGKANLRLISCPYPPQTQSRNTAVVKSRFLIGLAVSVVLLGLLLLKIPLGDIARAFAQASIPGLFLTLVLHALVLNLKVVRWNTVLTAVKKAATPPKWLSFDALFLGYFGNYALPAKLGEVGRSLLFSRGSGVPFSSVFATIVFERFIDALVLIAGFYAVLLLTEIPISLPGWVDISLQVAAAITVLGLLSLYFFWKHVPGPRLDARHNAQSESKGLVTRLADLAAGFRSGLAIIEKPRIGIYALLWTLVIWSAEAITVWICLLSFGVDVHWSAPVLLMVISSFAIAAPSAPGGLGVHQWVTILVLAPYGVSEANSAAASLVLTLAVVFWVVPLGLHGLWRQGYSTSELRDEYEAMS